MRRVVWYLMLLLIFLLITAQSLIAQNYRQNYCTQFNISPANTQIGSTATITLTSPTYQMVFVKNDYFYPLNNAQLSSTIKSCVNLVDIATGVGTQPTTVAYDIANKKYISVTFNSLPSNKQYRLRVKECLGVSVPDNPDNNIYFQPYLSYISYATSPASPLVYTPSTSFDFLQPCTLGARSDASFLDETFNYPKNASTSSNHYDTLSNNLKFNIKWNADDYHLNLSSVNVTDVAYYLKHPLSLTFHKTGTTTVTVPYVQNRFFHGSFEWVGSSFKPYYSQYISNREVQIMFDAFLQGDYDDILITTDSVAFNFLESITANPSSYSYEDLHVYTVEELLGVVSTYAAKFIKGSRTETVIYTGYGFRLSIQDPSSPEYISCSRNDLRNNYIYEDNVYHYLQYTDRLYELNSFDEAKIQYDLGANITITSDMFVDKSKTFKFTNSINSTLDGIYVELLDDVVTTNFYRNYYFINGYLRNVKAEMMIIPKDMVGDASSGLFMTRENFAKQASCSNAYGSDIGYQLSYFLNNNNYSLLSLPEYKERLGSSGVSYLLDKFVLNYNNNNYYKKVSIEIDRSVLQFKEPATNSSGYSFTLIPNTTPWNENNATINLLITNVGDLEGNFTIQFKCDSPITMKDASQATTKVILQAGESINLSIDVTSELFTQQITSHCYTNVTISSAPLWSTTDKQFYQAQPIVVDHGYFINRCLAAFHEPFLQINSVNHTVFGLVTDSNGQNILQSTVTVKISNTGSTFSNLTIELTPKDNNCPFTTNDIFKNQILNSGDYITLTFTIKNEAATTSTIFGNMANNLLYYMFLNVTTNNKDDCWSTIGKDISYNFNFTEIIVNSSVCNGNGNLCETTTCYGVNSTLIGNVCNGHGICSSFNNCTCSNGYTGPQCDTLIINNNNNNNECIGNCSNHGMCQNGNCVCLGGYSGNFCEFTTCYGTNSSLLTTVCSGHGTCSGFNNCTCLNGYTGNNCENQIVDDNANNNGCLNNCSSRGTCNHGSCLCDNNYSGNTCEFTTCFGTNSSSISVCSGHGICTSFDNCTCNAGYTGSTCNDVISVVVIDCPNNCSSKGTCNTNTGECLCNAGYSGNECQFTTCYGTNSSLINVCNNHGVCTSFDNCTCNAGYTGQQCDQLVNNNNGGNNNIICNGNCSNHGMCQNGNCVCDNGYDGTICQFTTCYGINSSLPTVCSNHGTCSSYNNCTCLSGYSGSNCETLNVVDNANNNDCLNNNCSSRGTCNHGSCLCDNGYSGNTCEFTTCFGTNSSLSSVCNGHGSCSSFNNCTCYSGYTGIDCSQVIIIDNNNNNNTNHGSSCVNNCSSRGSCQNGNCNCDTNYSGDYCQFTTCFGTNSSLSLTSTCQENCKHGTCIVESQQQSQSQQSQPLTCKCNEGWIGEYCNIQNFTCFGINPTSSKVCSGRGICIGLDKCNCTDPTIYSGPSCETKQYSATDCQFNNFNLEFIAKEWFKSQSIQITPTSVKSGTIIPITIPFTHFLSTQSIFQFHFNFKNSLKNNRLFKYEIITTCLDNGGSFYSLGRVVKNGEFRNSQNIILEDPSYGFGFSFKENNNDNPFLENIYCPITVKLTPTNLLNECYQYDKLNTNLNTNLNNNNLNNNLNNNYYLYNTTLKFENINTCQFLKESDLEQIIPTRQTLFNLIDTTLEEDIYQWHNDQQLKLQQELNNNNNNDTNIVITKVFKEKKNNWNVIQASNYTIDATLLMTAEILNTNHQFGTFIPILYCKDERIHDGSDFFINHNLNNYIILNELQDKVTFQFNITITNITANIIYPKLRGGQEGLANIEVNDLDLNCLLLTIPYPQSCWKSTTTTTTTATTTTATTTTASKRNVNAISGDKKVAGTTIIPYLNIKFKTNIKLPPLIGDYKFIQPVQAFEIGIVVVTYSVLSIGFASVFICSKIPRDRDFVMIQFANFVKDKLNRKKLQTAQELLAKKEEEEDHVPLCENCGHGSEKLSKYLIEVESNQRRPVRFYVCENQYCFDALSSLYNRNYREYFKCYNAITKQLMIDKEEIPFYVNKIDILDMPQISSHAITVNPNQTDLTHEVEGQTKVSKYWKENEWSRHAGLNVPIGLNEQLEDLEEENQLMLNSNGYHYEDDGVVNYSGNNYGGNGYNNNNGGGSTTTTLSSSSPYVPYRAFTNAKIREVKEVNIIDYAALMEEEF
ncbi:hypothetical protein ABK040_013066 [Willaertia magna]